MRAQLRDPVRTGWRLVVRASLGFDAAQTDATCGADGSERSGVWKGRKRLPDATCHLSCPYSNEYRNHLAPGNEKPDVERGRMAWRPRCRSAFTKNPDTLTSLRWLQVQIDNSGQQTRASSDLE
jgi:hypothetical protein